MQQSNETMTVAEGNRLIAAYMGHFAPMYYHSDWNKLIPVIVKISHMPLIGATEPRDVCYPVTFNMPDDNGKPMFRFCGFSLHHGNTLIEAAYSAVLEVIQFENDKTKDNGR